MYVVKIGKQYLGEGWQLYDSREDAARLFPVDGNKPRIVKLKTIADRTAESMRGLASDIEGDNGGGPS